MHYLWTEKFILFMYFIFILNGKFRNGAKYYFKLFINIYEWYLIFLIWRHKFGRLQASVKEININITYKQWYYTTQFKVTILKNNNYRSEVESSTRFSISQTRTNKKRDTAENIRSRIVTGEMRFKCQSPLDVAHAKLL